MRRRLSRTAAFGVALALAATAVPCAAGEPALLPARMSSKTLVQLSPASRSLLAAPDARAAQTKDPGASGPSSPSAFFKSTRGKITLALMGAGAGFAIWSVHHDRIPVKSPVR